MARVVLEQLTKVFRGSNGDRVCALTEVDLEIRDQELMALIGPSGCGKTTLLRLIAGLETPNAGSVHLDGARVNDLPPKARDVAMVFQQPALYPHLSVFENVAFGLRVRGHGAAEIRQRVDELASMLQLTTLLDRRPMELSGGQQQRVAVGRALARRPKLLLLDEPFSHLDISLRQQFQSELVRLHRELRCTMLYVTHDPTEAMSLGQRVAVMAAGRLLQVDAPEQLYYQPAHLRVAKQIASPPMALLEGQLVSQEGAVAFRPISREGVSGVVLRLDAAGAERLAKRVGQHVTLGIRPEQTSFRTSIEAAADGQWISGTVAFVESTWPGRQAQVAVAGGTLTWQLSNGTLPYPGQSVQVRLDLQRAHFFDAEGRAW